MSSRGLAVSKKSARLVEATGGPPSDFTACARPRSSDRLLNSPDRRASRVDYLRQLTFLTGQSLGVIAPFHHLDKTLLQFIGAWAGFAVTNHQIINPHNWRDLPR